MDTNVVSTPKGGGDTKRACLLIPGEYGVHLRLMIILGNQEGGRVAEWLLKENEMVCRSG